jgi:hypothetical protein
VADKESERRREERAYHIDSGWKYERPIDQPYPIVNGNEKVKEILSSVTKLLDLDSDDLSLSGQTAQE